MQNCNRQIEKIQKEVDDIMIEKTQGAMLRTHFKWFDGGKKITKYFFNLEKSKAKKKVISKIVNKNQNIVTEEQQILQVIQKYYEKLFASANLNLREDYLNDIVTPK